METTNNTILITGWKKEWGLRPQNNLAIWGNKVIMVARNHERLSDEAAEIPNSVAIACDLSNEQDMRKLISTLKMSILI